MAWLGRITTIYQHSVGKTTRKIFFSDKSSAVHALELAHSLYLIVYVKHIEISFLLVADRVICVPMIHTSQSVSNILANVSVVKSKDSMLFNLVDMNAFVINQKWWGIPLSEKNKRIQGNSIRAKPPD